METAALTPYEQAQVERIAVWKGRRPGPVKRFVDFLRRPLNRVLEHVLPSEHAEQVLRKLNDAADWNVGAALIRRESGLNDLTGLRQVSLEDCDRLERRVECVAAAEITTESLLGGVGGLATELAALPAEVFLALRTVHRIASCYGYVLDREKDRNLVLAVIGLSLVERPEERTRRCEQIRVMEHLGMELHLDENSRNEIRDEAGKDAVEELGVILLEQKLEESIPFLGEAVGVVLDNAFLHAVEETARYVFQERWLLENGKTGPILPSESSRDVARTVSYALTNAAYATGYGVGFGAAFPAIVISRAGTAVLPGVVLHGLADGASAARSDAAGITIRWPAAPGGVFP